MQTKLRAAAALCAAVTLAACGGGEEKQKTAAAAPALTVSVVTVTQQPMSRRVEASGTVTAWEEVPVGSEAGGLTAVQVLADEGSYVRQGQVLVKLNDDLLASQQRQQEASVASARATLNQADANLSRARELRQRGFLAQASLDARLAEQQTAQAQLAAAQAALAETVTRRDQTNIRAPVGGLITARSVVKGQIVAAGTELLRLVRDGRLELDAQIPESELGLVRAGMPATVSSNEVGEVGGVVRIVTPQVDPQTRLGLARIALSSPKGFRPGMFARGVIEVGAQPTLVVPTAAILYRDNKAGVFVLDRTNHAQFRPLRTGDRTGNNTEVLAGLNAGERVVVEGAGFLSEGDAVRVAPAK